MKNGICVLLLLYLCSLLNASAQSTHPAEVDALQAVKARLSDPKSYLKNWSKGDPCTSKWTGVWCFDKVGSDGYYHIKDIQLLNMNLSGTLAPELQQLSHLEGLDFMWNQITGSIPKEIGNLSSLKTLVLNGNLLSGSLPDELGLLANLSRLQLDENNLSGSIPKSFGKMSGMKHFHLNNNSFSGQLPVELSQIQSLVHLLLDNNNLSGNIPPQFSGLSELEILQLDNNHFVGAAIPESYQNLSRLVKISLRNCSLGGALPDFSQMPYLSYIDLSWNKLTGAIPAHRLSDNITTIDLSHNKLNGSIPESFSYLPSLQMLSLQNNSLNGSVPAQIWHNKSLAGNARLSIDFRYNFLSDISGNLNLPQNVNLRIKYATWHFPGSELFGPYELLNFTLLGPYSSVKFQNNKSSINKAVLSVILIGVALFAVITTVAVTLLILKWKRRQRQLSSRILSEKMSIKIDGVKEFTFKEMARATNNFNSSSQVGRGGYGKVYKGTLADDTVIAVKRAEEGSLQGTREFLTEIHILSRLHHRNLVSLVGYCGENGEQMLVYEFMPNGTLQDWLAGKSERSLSFWMRLRIALGAAKGILYLHREANPPIFHRDIKASNILLDSNLIAKVADFGLSRLAPAIDDEGDVSHHVSTVVKGTPGYLDPEYCLTHKLTDKSDVYSLGVVFLELLTGVRPISYGKNLVREVSAAHKSGTLLDIIDSRMNGYSCECVERFIALARRCCEDKPETRPSMLDVVRELEDILQMAPESITMSDTTSISSSSTNLSVAYPHSSSYVSGSDLITGVTPTIAPR